MVRRNGARVWALGTVVTALGLCLTTAPGTATADTGDISNVNQSIHIEAGDHAGKVSTVNGSIRIGANAVVGNASTVNGSLNLDSRATAAKLDTVNGSIHLEDGVQVHGRVRSVNGSLHIGNDADVDGDLANVNGSIHVGASHIGGSINTSSGGIDLGPNAHVDGGVKVERDNSWHFGFWDFGRPQEIIIRPGTVVKGTLHFERPVVLYVSNRATIGAVEGAEVRKFSGDNPPND
jgi:hypothetical protein